MAKRIILTFLSIICINTFTFGIDAWIRINQLGYLPNAKKKAVFISESPQTITQFTLHDALTNELLAELKSVKSYGEFQLFKSTFILDFSSFKQQGAFYIKAGLVFSPTIHINKNTYLGSADLLLNFLRGQRCGYNPLLEDNCNEMGSVEAQEEDARKVIIPEPTTKPQKKAGKSLSVKPLEIVAPKQVDVTGGWHNASASKQYGGISANTVFQLLFAYQLHPTTFSDTHDAIGKLNANGIPDILDEAKWGLDWLLKMSPDKEVLYHQISNQNDNKSTSLPTENRQDYGFQKAERLVYLATGKPQGQLNNTNQSTGIASIAGKYASAFALGAELFAKFSPAFADSLSAKAIDVYEYGKTKPGVCQTLPDKAPYNFEEANWADDMELAATQLYRLTYNNSYLKDAASYGRMEPVTPWMCSDTARHYQWYPFLNLGHNMLASVENPRYQKEFLQNMLNGIQRVNLQAVGNPFNMGVPMILASNNLVTAMATQCVLYRKLTRDSTFIDMETALTDWVLGCNPWGTSMVMGVPKIGDYPTSPYSNEPSSKQNQLMGGLVNGPVGAKVYNNLPDLALSRKDVYERFQTPFAVYHDDNADFATNEPTLDGTAALTYLFANKQTEGVPLKTADKNEYFKGGVTRTDISKKQISLVFAGHEYADGYKIIRKALNKLNIKASFFFTGDFYRHRKFSKIIKGLQEDKHYLGASSDKNLLYCAWQNQDSLLVNKTTFLNDLKANYVAMEKFGIQKKQAPFFLPAHEWYNDSISQWSKEVGLNTVSFTPGSLSNTDASIPEMREKYFSTTEIFNKIKQVEANEGLNGHILLFHIGADKKRQDKFYNRLSSLLIELSRSGYNFVDLYKATDLVDKEIDVLPNRKQKRKN